MGGTFSRRAAVVAAYLAFVAALSAAAGWFGYVAALEQLSRKGQSDLSLAADRLTGELLRFKELAVLLADHPVLTPLVSDAAVDAEAARALLRATADKTGSLDIRVLDAAGREVAAAAHAVPEDVVPGPAWRRAMDGALGMQHLWSARYGRRAFVFAAPIFSAEGPAIGAVLVVTDVEQVEAGWRGDRPTVFFTDALGVVFVSNRSELIFRARGGDITSAGLSAEYPTGRITGFPVYRSRTFRGHDLWSVDGGPYVPQRALHLSMPLPVVEMTGEALLDAAPARQLAVLQAAAAAALCLAFGAVLFLATERRRALAIANRLLEARVARRTAELSAANTDLRREVAERSAAEARLKQAQADLVQAGKLSALGRMSAGISHELNQPLMAIRSFAENGAAFLERDKPEKAAENLRRISDLARRMGRIIRNLRAFARQESAPIADVDLGGVVETVLEIVAGTARQAEVALDWQPPETPIVVRGGEVRLQQVILNLVTNGIDAMTGAEERRVEIRAEVEGLRAVLTVRDTGPGIAEPGRIFDPFYTTKAVGSDGMGLGLSISYGLVQSFGGAIRGRNHPGGGAVFTVELDLAPVLAEEAA